MSRIEGVRFSLGDEDQIVAEADEIRGCVFDRVALVQHRDGRVELWPNPDGTRAGRTLLSERGRMNLETAKAETTLTALGKCPYCGQREGHRLHCQRDRKDSTRG